MKIKKIIKKIIIVLILMGGLFFWFKAKEEIIATTIEPEKVAQDFINWHWNRLQSLPGRRGVNPDKNELFSRSEISDELKSRLLKITQKIGTKSTYDLISCSLRQPLRIDFVEYTQTEDEATVKFKKLYSGPNETEFILELKRIDGVWQIMKIPCSEDEIQDEIAKARQLEINR